MLGLTPQQRRFADNLLKGMNNEPSGRGRWP